MQLKYKTLDYQNDAVKAVIDVFAGQKYHDITPFSTSFKGQGSIEFNTDTGFSNPSLEVSAANILKNIRNIQQANNIALSSNLSSALGNVDLDVEMETGTGKTYVYIKTMYELNKAYGFSKFIIVVPSIAIREGVEKTFSSCEEHFMNIYGKKIRYFKYNSRQLSEIEHFSSSESINAMIINMQAFNTRGADARRIYEELDDFSSKRPIDVIAQTRPILIMDEPQKMGGTSTQQSLKEFSPLFTINYSATHKAKHNLVYVLDALDSYNKKIVKKIEVKGFTIKNLRGINGYVFLEGINVSSHGAPKAKITFQINYAKTSINNESRLLNVGDDLYFKSNKLEQYKDGYKITDVDAQNNLVTFLNGMTLSIGEAVGDVTENDLRRIQIRETIKSHIEKEMQLYDLNIKVLSLFFIDEVAKYRKYDSEGNEINSLYGEMFEEEYKNIVDEYLKNVNTKYAEYLESIRPKDTHKGYFSIDKHKHIVDSAIKRGTTISDDESAYDLILRDKERLLSFDEPTRFIFSHSALREGWDNPNIFQICTLKHSDSDVQRHQEVGRGLRLCVNASGDRIDSSFDELNVHIINKLTVIANDSYETYVKGLQTEIANNLYERPKRATADYFVNKSVRFHEAKIKINDRQARDIYKYLIKNDYLDDDDRPNDKYKEDFKNAKLEILPNELELFADDIHLLIKAIYDASAISSIIENANSTKLVENKLNDNFKNEEFQKLWKQINHKYTYMVKFDTSELIKKCTSAINKSLSVTNLMYTVSTSEQKDRIDSTDIKLKQSFKDVTTNVTILHVNNGKTVFYDLIGKIAEQTNLRRKTIFSILDKMADEKFNFFKENPEEFINKVSRIINEQKASILIEHIEYNQSNDTFDSNIFVETKKICDLKNAFKAKHHIKDYVVTDGYAEKSIERKFVENLDNSNQVVVYAKLPVKFYIPTPVGNYSPDWAIVFKKDNVNHVYFIAETKGNLSSLSIRPVEQIKIECAKKLFSKMSTENIKYGKVDSYDELLNIIYGTK